ncbi:MAG: agmatine deiminase family protein, partial [Salinivirgaceae bacterium]|nr:agmatine deiminase family protein [Salinivirgaceae bacterium]
MIKKILLIAIAFLLFTDIGAQQIKQTFKGKTHMVSEDELLKLNTVGKDFIETDPPVGDIRNIAEFERTEGIIVTYHNADNSDYFGIPVDLIAEISENALVYTLVLNNMYKDQVIDIFESNNVLMANVVFVISDTDSYWSRDYSPWFIANDNTVSIVNFPYNRPRPNDNDIPLTFGYQFGLDVYGMNLISTGGNYMTDGMGVAASCDLVYKEN